MNQSAKFYYKNVICSRLQCVPQSVRNFDGIFSRHCHHYNSSASSSSSSSVRGGDRQQEQLQQQSGPFGKIHQIHLLSWMKQAKIVPNLIPVGICDMIYHQIAGSKRTCLTKKDTLVYLGHVSNTIGMPIEDLLGMLELAGPPPPAAAAHRLSSSSAGSNTSSPRGGATTPGGSITQRLYLGSPRQRDIDRLARPRGELHCCPRCALREHSISAVLWPGKLTELKELYNQKHKGRPVTSCPPSPSSSLSSAPHRRCGGAAATVTTGRSSVSNGGDTSNRQQHHQHRSAAALQQRHQRRSQQPY